MPAIKVNYFGNAAPQITTPLCSGQNVAFTICSVFLIVFNSICQGIEVGSKCLSFLVYNSVLTFEVQQYEFSPSFFVELKKDSCMGGHCRRCI